MRGPIQLPKMKRKPRSRQMLVHCRDASTSMHIRRMPLDLQKISSGATLGAKKSHTMSVAEMIAKSKAPEWC